MRDEKMTGGAKRVHVLGLARSGAAAALLAASRGYETSATDLKQADDIPDAARLAAAGVRLDLGGHDPELFRRADIVVVSPGVPGRGELDEAARRGARVVAEVEFAFGFLEASVIGVTGSNGKSTVTSMIGAIMEKTGAPTWTGGNLGTALSLAVDSPANRPGGWIVAELSSFQLERVERFRPRVALILNITPDHLDRYAGFEEYAAAKCNIFRSQRPDDHLVIPAGDPPLARRCAAAPGRLHLAGGDDGEVAFRDGAILVPAAGEEPATLLDPRSCGLADPLALHNGMLAILAARCAGAGVDALREGLRAFRPLAHRFQLVAEIGGVRWVDDSKATNPESVVKGLEAAGANVILIAGGLGKGLDFAPLAGAARGRVASAILIGTSAPAIAAVLEGIAPVRRAGSLREAVEAAAAAARPGDTVLLSPACASFDMFRDYEDRGDQFAALALELGGKQSPPAGR